MNTSQAIVARWSAPLLILLWATMLAAAQPRVYRERVEPHWFASDTRFWYRNDLADNQREFILVDAEKGTRTPAFDHVAVAAALSKATGQNIAAGQLPIDQLDFAVDLSSVVLHARGKAWRLDRKTHELTPADATASPPPSLPPSVRPRPSVRTGPETEIAFINRTSGDIALFWIDPEGQRRPYGTIKPGERHDQHTFAGHNWLAADAATGRVLGVYEATSDRSTAIVDGKPSATAPATSPRLRRAGRGGDSPDGQWTAFIRADNVWLRHRATREEFALSTDGKTGDSYSEGALWWSPDSKKLFALRTAAAQEHKIYIVESSPKDQLQPKLRTLDYLKPGDRIAHPRPRLFDIASRSPIAVSEVLFANPWSIDTIRWSSDSSNVTFLYNQRGHQVLRVVSVDAATGVARSLIDEQSKTFICYSGKFLYRWIGEEEVLWMSERDGWNHLYLFDGRAGKLKNPITRGEWVVQSVVHVDEAKRQIWFNAGGVRPGQDPYFTHFCRVDFDGSNLVVLTEGDGQHAVQWTPGARWFIDSWSRVDQPPITELRRSDTGQVVCRLEEADASEVLTARGGRWPQRFIAKGRDGKTDIHGVILFPRDFDPSRKYPVVENIYAGPQGFFAPKAFRARYGHQQPIGDRGIIIVQCDGMGTSGRSKAFHDVCFQNLRDAGFPDRITWIKAAAAKYPQMDLDRVGIYGGSAGGQNAMAALLWHNDFYKVAVADCGCHDNRMDKIWWNEQWMGWPVGDAYKENSNSVNAHLLKGKLMLFVGELDSNVDPASTMQVVNALEAADKDFDLVVMTNTGHGSAETPYGSRRRADFLARHLDADKIVPLKP